MMFFYIFSLAECNVDQDCPYDKSCISQHCLNPCTHGSVQCGKSATCSVHYHRASCECPKGTQGDPMISCISGLCQYNEDCADHESCDKLNHICHPVCDKNSCGTGAYCEGINHGNFQEFIINIRFLVLKCF